MPHQVECGVHVGSHYTQRAIKTKISDSIQTSRQPHHFNHLITPKTSLLGDANSGTASDHPHYQIVVAAGNTGGATSNLGAARRQAAHFPVERNSEAEGASWNFPSSGNKPSSSKLYRSLSGCTFIPFLLWPRRQPFVGGPLICSYLLITLVAGRRILPWQNHD